MASIILGFSIILVFLTLYLVSAARQRKAKHINPNPAEEDVYDSFRIQFLSLKPHDLHLTIPADKQVVYGVAMEINLGSGIVTIVSTLAGDASMYTSTGGGVIGGIGHQNVKDAAIALIAEAQKHLEQMAVAKNNDTPKNGNVKFFILTNKHKYSTEGPEAEVTALNSKWASLFNKGNDVVTQLRMVAN